MFPSELFSLFPPFPWEQRVFVAMSFAAPFQRRWESVIKPAISSVGLTPFRVDVSTISESILTQILRGVSSSKLIFADVTNTNGFTNPNVMYEIGLAHAVRQPQEVILFRSDNEKLLFDLAHVKVNFYEPDTNADASKASVENALTEAMAETEQRKGIAVDKATDALDQNAIEIMLKASNGSIRYPKIRTVRDHLQNVPKISALSRLLELRLVKAQYPTWTIDDLQDGRMDEPLEDLVTYQLTALGDAVIANLATKLGFGELVRDPAKRQLIDEMFAKYDQLEEPSKLPIQPSS
jgi:nucleoside 2-deoxyribosyltransferase